MTPDAMARIHASFGAQSMMTTLGAQLSEVQEELVRITAPIAAGVLQQQGFAHAGLTFSLGDSAAGYAALTLMPLENEVVTAEIKINLLAPAHGTHLIATGRVIKPGRRLCVVSAEVHAAQNGDQKLVAVLQGTMVPVPV